MIGYIIKPGASLPPVEVTGRFVVVVTKVTNKRWEVIDRIGAPVGDHMLLADGTFYTAHGLPLPPGYQWLCDGDGEPGYVIMMQGEEYNENGSHAYKHCRWLNEHADKIPTI